MENMKGYYAQDCGPASHNQAMIADENDDKGRTVAVVYDREKARAIVKACNSHEELVHSVQNLLDDIDALQRLTTWPYLLAGRGRGSPCLRANSLLDEIRAS